MNFIKEILSSFTAEDVLGIEVIYNSRFTNKYDATFLSTDELFQTSKTQRRAMDYAYLEITTRNGQGPFLKKTPGVYWYRPLPFSLPNRILIESPTKVYRNVSQMPYSRPRPTRRLD